MLIYSQDAHSQESTPSGFLKSGSSVIEKLSMKMTKPERLIAVFAEKPSSVPCRQLKKIPVTPIAEDPMPSSGLWRH